MLELSSSSGVAMPPALEPLSPFARHALHGWDTAHGGARFPVTCAVYEEGPNLALYMTPAGVPPLATALGLPPDDLALVLETWSERARVLRWSELEGLDGDADLVHLPAGTALDATTLDELPVPLLACLPEALPAGLGSRVALSVQDGCHGAVVARERGLLRRALASLLEDYARAVLGPEAGDGGFDRPLLDTLLEPQTPGTCFELSLSSRRRFLVLDAVTHGEDAQRSLRWVRSASGGRWRAWSWEETEPTLPLP